MCDYEILQRLNKLMSSSLIGSQLKAYKLMCSGANLMLSGVSGSGKSTTIKSFVNVYKDVKTIGVTSTTGISSLLIGGTTLHSYLGIGLGKGDVESLCKRIRKNRYIYNRWLELDTLIIDEVSMLSCSLFDKLDSSFQIIRNCSQPFGGVQLILSGDFLQLPCVGEDTRFCFESSKWSKIVSNTVFLREIIRQKSTKLQRCLNEVREGKISDEMKNLLLSRVGIKLENEYGIRPTRLYSTNRMVDNLNEEELDKLANKYNPQFYEYNMNIRGPTKHNLNKYRKMCNAGESVQLCKFAQVMLLYNMDPSIGLVNGSRGVVTGFAGDYPIVRFLNGISRVIKLHNWEIESKNLKITITQIPLRIAYALTIHKSQGCSLDYAEIDLGGIFEYGQAYVALSRVKNIEGLSIISINFDTIRSDPRALTYYSLLNDT